MPAISKVAISNVHKSFGHSPVLCGVSFELARGELVGLVGPSGGGKSVLLKILAQVILPDSGSIIYSGQRGQITERPSAGFLFQEGALFDSMTVLENVTFPLLAQCETTSFENEKSAVVTKDEAIARGEEILEQVGLKRAIFKVPGELSGGMRRRVAIARALVTKPALVFLDDPTGGLDPVAAHVIMRLIVDLHTTYRPTMILVSHDIRRLLPSIHRLLALFSGKILSDSIPSEIVTSSPKEVVEFLATRFDFSQPFRSELPPRNEHPAGAN